MSVEYVNRRGETFYLCEKQDGERHRFFFSTAQEANQLDKIPEGYEIYEDPEGDPHLQRKDSLKIKSEGRSLVEKKLEKIDHLNRLPNYHLVDVRNGSITIFILDQTPEVMADVNKFVPEAVLGNLEEFLNQEPTYTAHMKFELADESERKYRVYRRLFYGDQKYEEDKWLYLEGMKSLPNLASKYLPHIDKDSFFDLGI